MRRILVSIFLIFPLILSAFDSDAAFVKTKYGAIEGNVVVRQFEDLVVTIKTRDQRLFQFYGADVVSVTASTKILAGTAVFLREEPSESALPTVELATGCQVDFAEDAPQGDWVKVKIWGANQGWIQHNILTDTVLFRSKTTNSRSDHHPADVHSEPPPGSKEQ